MKRSLRSRLLSQRDGIEATRKKRKEAAIKKRLFALSHFKRAEKILFYASFRSEVDTFKCMQSTLNNGRLIVLPVVDETHKKLRLYKVKDISELHTGYMGIPEPIAERKRKIGVKGIDVVIIPGIGFDMQGNRLGYGAGYYDRLLSVSREHITSIALSFEEQIVERVPSEPHDIRVDMIVTDSRLIRCKG